MSKLKDKKKKLKSKIRALKKVMEDENFKKTAEETVDNYLKDLPSLTEYQNKLGDFATKAKKKVQEKTDAFKDLIDITDELLIKNNQPPGKEKFYSRKRLKIHANDSINETIKSGKNIVLENVKKILFADDGICGGNSKFSGATMDEVRIKPKEIDFFDMLSVDPSSSTGKIMYETPPPGYGKVKVNRELYNQFTAVIPFRFDTTSNNTLFDMSWDASNQEFIVTGLTQGSTVDFIDFFNDYFTTIEFPDLSGITKTAIMMTLQGDESQTPLMSGAFNDLNRLTNKLFSLCGSPKKKNELQQSPVDQFNESDEDIELYFDFDNIEGIDLDDESARLRKVLRFRDCNNFEIPVNNKKISEFVYLSSKKNTNDLIEDTLNSSGLDAYEKSDKSIPLTNFQLSLNNTFILNLPKALIASIISPKVFLPIVIVYKLTKNLSATLAGNFLEGTKFLMRQLKKLFGSIIKDLFWKFLNEFWKRIKKDLIDFLRDFAIKILKDKYKNYYMVIQSLLPFLRKAITEGFDNCQDMLQSLLTAIEGALNKSANLEIPTYALFGAVFRKGFSEKKTFFDFMEGLEKEGVDTGDINGEPNKFIGAMSKFLSAHTKNQLVDGKFVGTNNIPIPVVVSPGGGAGFITPGSMKLTSIMHP